ncbi:astacin-like metalloprotease toxin 5 [Parasteatoda tepidariorum]|uniref:astacin-like metalloprotease toxin 5 n=1 Tax=Parasteatoda tepidariorum TaxID=114398 RepID=UPI00077F9D86|nr:astacin-like metalloprotease toxin 5 [Parasteatoda tepidariorum]
MILTGCILVVLVATALGNNAADESQLAMENPDLFEGDITNIDPNDRNAHPQKIRRWPKGEIPYVIEKSLEEHRDLILSAFEDFNKKTCLKFVPKTNQRNYIQLYSGRGCFGPVGMTNWGQQLLSIGPGCLYKGVIIHELGHAIGFFHEHNRSDRDKYIKVHWENIKSGMAPQFTKLNPHENLIFNEFDYDSIMIYGNTAFSKDLKNKVWTMEALNGRKLENAFYKEGLTPSDVERIQKMYDC